MAKLKFDTTKTDFTPDVIEGGYFPDYVAMGNYLQEKSEGTVTQEFITLDPVDFLALAKSDSNLDWAEA